MPRSLYWMEGGECTMRRMRCLWLERVSRNSQKVLPCRSSPGWLYCQMDSFHGRLLWGKGEGGGGFEDAGGIMDGHAYR